MHAYAAEETDRRRSTLTIAILAAVLAYALFGALRAIDVTPAWWIDVPSVLGFYGPLWVLHDRVTWRWRVFGVRLSPIADYSGRWAGTLESSYNGQSYNIEVDITQRWTTIGIKLKTANSSSHSTMAVVNSLQSASPGLRYEYRNEPRPLNPSTMLPHRGVANLEPDGPQRLKGDYVSGLHRQTSGRITLAKV